MAGTTSRSIDSHPLVAHDSETGQTAPDRTINDVDVASHGSSKQPKELPGFSLNSEQRRQRSYTSYDAAADVGDVSQDSNMDDVDGGEDGEGSNSGSSEDSAVFYNAQSNGAVYERIHTQEDDEEEEEEETSLQGYGVDEQDDDGEEEARRRKRRQQRKQQRRVYGGGRRASLAGGHSAHSLSNYPSSSSSASKGLLSTSFSLFVASLSPGYVLLLPYAYSLTGLSLGIPFTVLLLLLGQSLSLVLLTVEGRYVGSRSYHSLAGAVFPQSYGFKHLGELLVLLFQVFVDGGRALVALFLATELVIDLSLAAFPRARVLHSKVFISLLLGLSFFVPSFLFSSSSARRQHPRHRRRRPIIPRSISLLLTQQIPSYTIFLYPIILLILGVSLKNLSDYPSLLKPSHDHLRFTKPSYSTAPLRTPTLWSGVSILFLLCSSTHSSTFRLYKTLKKRPSLPPASTTTSSALDVHSSNVSTGAGKTQPVLMKLINANRFETCTLLSSFLTASVFIPFGIIGYVSLLKIKPNIFELLPRDHAWFNVARTLSLFTILVSLPGNVGLAIEAAARGLELSMKIGSGLVGSMRGGGDSRHEQVGATSSRRKANSGSSRHKRQGSALELGGSGQGSDGDQDSDNDEEDGDSHRSLLDSSRIRWMVWTTRLATPLVWAAVIAVACTVNDLAGIAELVGCVGCAGLGFILPATFHIVLFHLRAPRTIFLTSSSSLQLQSDTLLLQKERQLQKRLMGKRIGMDLGAFGVLLPLGIVGMGRGLWAVVQG